jgi:hypothetical protein
VVKGQVLVLRAGTLAAIRSDVLAHHKLNSGREAAEKALLNALWRVRPRDVDLEREEFDDLVVGLASYTMFNYAWWPTVSAQAALTRLADPDLAVRLAAGTLSEPEARLLSAGLAELGSAGPTVADGALLDELVDLLGPVPVEEDGEVSLFLDADSEVTEVVTTADRLARPREIDPFELPYATYAHVLVDEAQDITPMQWRMLRRRGAGASWTIVGDPAQSSWPDPEEAARALQEIVRTAPVRRFRMSTNYRSPAEVFNLASRVVVTAYPEADLPTAVRSTGVEPRLAVAPGDLLDGVRREVADLLGEVAGTVGVICPPSLRDAVLADVDAAGLDPAGRLAVVTSLESKGLEYDGVLVVEPDRVVAESPGGVRSLYVALTRPTQRLVTLDAAEGAAWRRSLG